MSHKLLTMITVLTAVINFLIFAKCTNTDEQANLRTSFSTNSGNLQANPVNHLRLIRQINNTKDMKPNQTIQPYNKSNETKQVDEKELLTARQQGQLRTLTAILTILFILYLIEGMYLAYRESRPEPEDNMETGDSIEFSNEPSPLSDRSTDDKSVSKKKEAAKVINLPLNTLKRTGSPATSLPVKSVAKVDSNVGKTKQPEVPKAKSNVSLAKKSTADDSDEDENKEDEDGFDDVIFHTEEF
ncbi:hypothetical protein HDE_06680 [Halotydeus destructor]|nr:hypothetical protein HDE_06680 [Halotydeus destructor]